MKAAVLSLAILLMSGAFPTASASPAAARPAGAKGTAAKRSPAKSTAKPLTPLQRLERLKNGPRRAVIDAAYAAYTNAVTEGSAVRSGLLTVIDYSLPSTEPRLWVLDLTRMRILYRELVAHGRGSGDNFATEFSNDEGSYMSSLGLFVTDEAYMGKNGYSMRLRGLDEGVNDRAYDRAIVVHGATYVSQKVADAAGRLGRSLGCPAVRMPVVRRLINTIKDGSVMYVYGEPHTTPLLSPAQSTTASR
jgi:hypothetical protein